MLSSTVSSSKKPRVLFMCVHNSCRSQMAEAIGKHLAGASIDFASAGTEVKPNINQDAVRLMKEIYGIDMEKKQYSMLYTNEIKVDYLISMGCGVTCPVGAKAYDEDWGLADPTGKSDAEFKAVIATIEEKVRALIAKIQA